ncbi:MAG: S41 family peptidase [bacterium]|jgi:carboxyl-terminal processing protease
MNGRRRLAAGALVLVLLSSLFTCGLMMLRFRYLFKIGAGEIAQFNDFLTVYDYAKHVYVDPVPTETLLEGAMRGLLEALGDPNTAYLTQAQYQGLITRTEGNFGGVGVYVSQQGGDIVVVAPIEGMPGEKAGIRRGDIIAAVDGADVTGLSLDEVLAAMRGPVGTAVRLKVRREGETDLPEFVITRVNIEINTVEAERLESGIGYIRITEFNQNTSNNLQSSLQTLRAQGVDGLILDLRNNPGGLLQEGRLVAAALVPPGPVVHIVNREGEKDTLNTTSAGLGVPLAVLVNGGSASASEIVAGAVKDRAAGTLVGTRTYGKGSVQGLFRLSNGGGFRLTTDKYLTPGGISIHGTGIDPDILVYGLGDRELVSAASGADVACLQQALNDLGFDAGPENGIYGPATVAAVESFQRAKGLAVDGKAGIGLIYRIWDDWISATGGHNLPDTQLETAVAFLRGNR